VNLNNIPRRHRNLAQIKSGLNPEVADIMGGMDSDSYVESQKNILFEQTFNNTDKYSMTPDQYETLVQKEKD